jgi:ornithine cyclodeaminase/alanine dehydrogenase-like protein (mu-crystallin family)
VVVTVTDLEGPGAARRVAAAGSARLRSRRERPARRELDNVVLERAAFVCCDSIENAKRESGDLIEPVEAGVLDWLEVHELQEVVAG